MAHSEARRARVQKVNILCIGDIVGKPGRNAVDGLLASLCKEFSVEVVIANAENAAGGAGLTSRLAKDFFSMGCHVLTMGDHVWDQKDLQEFLDKTPYLLRPANFPDGVPGHGWCVYKTPSGARVGVVNLLGRVFMRYNVQCPFETLRKIIPEIQKQTHTIIVDMHAEATSEKIALGHFADGQVTAVVGTHTHVQTADEKILPGKTAYITDMGMTGPCDSVIGQNKEKIIKRFLTSMPVKFDVAENDVWLNGVVISVDEQTGRPSDIIRVQRAFAQKQETSF